ncbi:head-tail connector protein [Acinetobacter bereziniae]|uniref:head-tail connector protein n=1 Tax=Acinetobacter bereziniae TaxID=106648 RepID=UPI0015DA8933|nr:head-tail connector protein [Acinetobacter bereziniae]
MSDLITLEMTKKHLRVIHDRDDAYIELLIKAATQNVLDFIDFSDWDAVKEKYKGAIPKNLSVAALLIISDMYQNRASQTDVNLYVNRACENLMFSSRNMGV